ncbi:MAG: DUF885 domain-containing protein [Betaproteobacteria bacterium]|nr:DUF885 domain-containing protein [Betaproteobacteria bacterium]
MRLPLRHSRSPLRWWPLILALLGALAGCATTPTATPGPAQAGAPPAAAAALHALFDADWEDSMRRYPEWATYVGDHRYGDRLHDASPENEADAYARQRQRLQAAQALPREMLETKDRASLDIFIHGLQDDLTFEPLLGYRRLSLGATGGFHTGFSNLLRASPTRNKTQAEQVLVRLAAYPRRVDQEIARLQQGLLLGWVASQPVIERVLVTLDLQLSETGDKSPFFEPFTRLDAGIGAADRAALQAQARTLLGAQVLPAQKRLRDFVAGPYAAAAPPVGGLGRYPGGAAVYAALVRSTTTTTDLTPAQIHAIGLREVARLRGEIAQVMRDANWAGDFASFVQHLNTDPSYFHTSAEALLAGYRDIGKRLDAGLPRLFAELPRAPWGVRPMPSHMGPDAAEYYDPPPLDGSGPGWFNANAAGFRTRPIWAMESLTAHEAVPGHHLQTARAIELGDLPRFRRANEFVAYGEGWALYAETLGADLGLYRDAPSRFGFLQNQIWRAARLVVDTGLHDQGWSRQRAIDYLIDTTGIDVGKVSSEVDRYTSWPGQALGYMIGQLKIVELRDRARDALGDRFDIRRFHMVLLDQGAVPLGVLESQVDGWIAAERARR